MATVVFARGLAGFRRGATLALNKTCMPLKGLSNVQVSYFSQKAPPAAPSRADELRKKGVDIETEYSSEISDIMKRQEEKKERRQSLVGLVISTKNAKTITIAVYRKRYFPKFNRSFNFRKKYMAHDEEELASVGDVVRIVSGKNYSTRKRHRLLDVMMKGNNLSSIEQSLKDSITADKTARNARLNQSAATLAMLNEELAKADPTAAPFTAANVTGKKASKKAVKANSTD